MKKFLLCLVVGVSLIMSSGCQVLTNLMPTQTPYPTYTPNPTFTPYPTFTPIPSPTSTPEPPKPKVLFEENDFSSVDSCFNVSPLSGGKLFAENGQYNIAVDKANYYIWSTCDQNLRNFVMDVDATFVDGPGDTGYGVFFRQDDSGGFYSFLISADGYYSLQGRYPSDDKIYNLLSWTSLREVLQGKKTNHLKVVAFGDQIELYVNGTLVGLTREGTLKSGTFGFIVETYKEKGAVVSFDNIIVTEP